MSIITGSKKHSFVCTDTGPQKLFEFDENGNVIWELSIGCYAFDIWRMPDDKFLFCHYGSEPSGVKIIDREGQVLFSYCTQHEVFGCQPIENGNILVGELRQKRLVEVDSTAKIVREIPVFYDREDMHEVMRTPRKCRNGEYLVAQPGLCMIIRYNEKGDILRRYQTHPDSFGVIERENGNILYTCKSGLYELDTEGNEVWAVTNADIPQMNIKWLLGMQFLTDGNVVVCNWLGHGCEKQGCPLFEINRKKEVVWACHCEEITSNMANFQITDETTCIK